MIRVIILLILLAGLSGLLANQKIQLPKAVQMADSEEDDWKLPTESQAVKPSIRYAKLLQLSPWETESRQVLASSKQVNSPEKVSRTWKLVGLIKKGSQRYIMLLENNKTTQYGLKSALPGGSYLRKINDDSIEVIQNDGKIEVIELYR
jgi:hypothetical protein